MSNRRFVLCPGKVRSEADGGTHHISARRLAELYGVPMGECAVLLESEPDYLPVRLIRLRPRTDGDYRGYLAKVTE